MFSKAYHNLFGSTSPLINEPTIDYNNTIHSFKSNNSTNFRPDSDDELDNDMSAIYSQFSENSTKLSNMPGSFSDRENASLKSKYGDYKSKFEDIGNYDSFKKVPRDSLFARDVTDRMRDRARDGTDRARDRASGTNRADDLYPMSVNDSYGANGTKYGSNYANGTNYRMPGRFSSSGKDDFTSRSDRVRPFSTGGLDEPKYEFKYDRPVYSSGYKASDDYKGYTRYTGGTSTGNYGIGDYGLNGLGDYGLESNYGTRRGASGNDARSGYGTEYGTSKYGTEPKYGTDSKYGTNYGAYRTKYTPSASRLFEIYSDQDKAKELIKLEQELNRESLTKFNTKFNNMNLKLNQFKQLNELNQNVISNNKYLNQLNELINIDNDPEINTNDTKYNKLRSEYLTELKNHQVFYQNYLKLFQKYKQSKSDKYSKVIEKLTLMKDTTQENSVKLLCENLLRDLKT